MAQRIEVPGMGVVEFPDGMSDDQITAAIKRNAGPTSPKQSGFMMGLGDPIHGSAQLLTKLLPRGMVESGDRFNNWMADKTGLVPRLPEGGVDQQVREREQSYQASRGPDAGMDWARLGGNILNPATLGVAGAVPRAMTLGGRVAAGAGTGAAVGAMAPTTGSEDFASEKLKQAATSAAFGGLVPGVAAGVGRVISPKASTNPALDLLKSEGVRPTIGQTLGGKANSAEEKLMSVPFVGDSVRNARARAADDLQQAVGNRALAPLGEKMPAGLSGREAVGHVERTLGKAYDKLLPRLTVQADDAFAQEVNGLQQMVRTGSIKPDAARAFNRILGQEVIGKFRGQDVLTGQTVKNIESSLGAQISRFGASTDADQRLLGDALKELQSSLRGLVRRSNPDMAEELQAVNQGWSVFKRMQRAASYVGAEDGAFNASQLQSAVRAMDRSKDHGGFARGGAVLQDLSDAANSVLGNKVPNSGTVDRALFAGLPAAFMHPGAAAGLAAGPALYSAPMQGLLRGLVSSRPASAQPIAGLLNQASPAFAPTGGLLGLEMLE